MTTEIRLSNLGQQDATLRALEIEARRTHPGHVLTRALSAFVTASDEPTRILGLQILGTVKDVGPTQGPVFGMLYRALHDDDSYDVRGTTDDVIEYMSGTSVSGRALTQAAHRVASTSADQTTFLNAALRSWEAVKAAVFFTGDLQRRGVSELRAAGGAARELANLLGTSPPVNTFDAAVFGRGVNVADPGRIHPDVERAIRGGGGSPNGPERSPPVPAPTPVGPSVPLPGQLPTVPGLPPLSPPPTFPNLGGTPPPLANGLNNPVLGAPPVVPGQGNNGKHVPMPPPDASQAERVAFVSAAVIALARVIGRSVPYVYQIVCLAYSIYLNLRILREQRDGRIGASSAPADIVDEASDADGALREVGNQLAVRSDFDRLDMDVRSLVDQDNG